VIARSLSIWVNFFPCESVSRQREKLKHPSRWSDPASDGESIARSSPRAQLAVTMKSLRVRFYARSAPLAWLRIHRFAQLKRALYAFASTFSKQTRRVALIWRYKCNARTTQPIIIQILITQTVTPTRPTFRRLSLR